MGENKELVWIFLHFSLYQGMLPLFKFLENEKQLTKILPGFDNTKYVRMPARIHITNPLQSLNFAKLSDFICSV